MGVAAFQSTRYGTPAARPHDLRTGAGRSRSDYVRQCTEKYPDQREFRRADLADAYLSYPYNILLRKQIISEPNTHAVLMGSPQAFDVMLAYYNLIVSDRPFSSREMDERTNAGILVPQRLQHTLVCAEMAIVCHKKLHIDSENARHRSE